MINEELIQCFRTPVVAIKGFVSTFLIDSDLSADEMREFFKIIDHECDLLMRGLNDLCERPEGESEREVIALRKHLTLLEIELDAREKSIQEQELDLTTKQETIRELYHAAHVQLAEAQAIKEASAKLTPEAAREQIIAAAEMAARSEVLRRTEAAQKEVEAEADRRAKQTILNSIQRVATDYTIESTSAVIQLPSEDMKGKLIGREGRNIRTFEQVAGVDLIIDENPNTVVVSSFDPVRRETARITLMNMMLDGRIHPARIEELHQKSVEEIDRVIRDAGEEAARRAKVYGISASVLSTLGRLRFRSSYAQNVLDHSVEVAELCALFAEELGLNVEVARRAGLLHDIGKALGPEWEGPHALAGMNYLKDAGETERVTHAVGAHHREIEPSSPEAQIVIVADSISASRPGARRENLDQYVKRVAQLEAIANAFPGVERSYAMQAGREVRLIVRPELVDDAGAVKLARDVAKKIETDLQYPGQIKVTVIRELRAHDTAK